MLRYELDLDIVLERPWFRGIVTICDYPIGQPLELDAIELRITAVRAGGHDLPFRIDSARGKLIVERLPDGGVPLRIEYDGAVGQGIQSGLFASRLGDHPAVSTQMEPEGCRRLLPCFDRPDRKAEFRVRATVDSGAIVISNTQGRSSSSPGGRTVWTFESTPPMSTYLLYVGVGPFEECRDASRAPTLVVAGPPGCGPRSRRTLAVARAAVDALAEYYDVPYPLAKLHFVALTDFWVGMENWGAISGAEAHYLLDAASPPLALRFADQTVVHEIAHQWFGDLVTLTGWEDLWLNEAFATFITPRIQERAHLRADPWGEFVLFSARGDPVDSLEATHPVKPDALDPKQMMAAADNITYFKGSRLIRMIEGYIGEEPFRRGISDYLKRHRFGSARSDDLWRSLEASSGRGVVQVMRPWIERSGHPVIEVAQDGPDVVLRQRRFTYLPRSEDDPPWPIPLRIGEGADGRVVLFDQRELRLTHTDARSILLDPGRTGFYRILLPPDLRGPVIEALMDRPPLDRWGFVHDARAFLLSGDYSLEDMIAILRAIRGATDSVTVEEVAEFLLLVGPSLADLPGFHAEAQEFCRAQSVRLEGRESSDAPRPDDSTRERIADRRAILDDDYAREMTTRFAALAGAPAPLRQSICFAYARFGGSGAADELMGRAVGADPMEAEQACRATEAISSAADVGRFLEHGLRSARLSDLFTGVIWGAARNPRGRTVTWEWLKANLRELERRAEGSYLLPYTLDLILPLLADEREPEMHAFFDAERFPGAEIGIRTGLETARAVALLRERVRTGSEPSPGRA